MSAKVRPPDRFDAAHEAAHAVVCIRRDLPLEYATIGRRGVIGRDFLDDREMVEIGITKIGGHVTMEWFDSLPDPAARAKVDDLATFMAAGIVSEVVRRDANLDDVKHRGDWQDLLKLIANLRQGGSMPDGPDATLVQAFGDPAVEDYIASALDRAQDILLQDDGTAWERVTTALFRKKYLTADAVRAIVTESDADTVKR